jgi:hypothetical protein
VKNDAFSHTQQLCNVRCVDHACLDLAANRKKRAPCESFAAAAHHDVFTRYLQQKRASKRGEQVEGDSDDGVEAGSLGVQGEAAGGQQEARAASPPPAVTTTTTLSKSGQTNKCVGVPLAL